MSTPTQPPSPSPSPPPAGSSAPRIPRGVHARWDPGAGLLLWSVDEGRVRFLARALGRRAPRHHVEIAPGGGAPDRNFEALALAPVDAAAFLADVSTGSAVLAEGEKADDLGYLSGVFAGIAAWIDVGHVVPELMRLDDEWWPVWRLPGTPEQRAWRAEWIAAMPPVLAVSGGQAAVFDDFAAALTDAEVRARVQGVPEAEPVAEGAGMIARHPLLAALVTGEAVSAHGAAASGRLAAWQESLASGEREMVLRVLEPADEEPAQQPKAGAGPGPADPADAMWRLQVCMRAQGRVPVPVVPADADGPALRMCLDGIAAAMAAYPLLRELPRDDASLDLLMPEAAVSDLVQHGSRALAAAGISVLLPRKWRVVDPEIRLAITSADLPATTDESRMGLAQLVEYDMSVALGGQELSAAELDELVRRQSDLVKLRGEWVHADYASLSDAARYLSGRRGDPATLAGLLRRLATDPPPVPLGSVSATGWVESLFGAEDPSLREVSPPEGLHARLRPYQLRGLAWLSYMADLGVGAVLADDMGLGKTLQVLALELSARSRGAVRPTLVVCPMSVVGNWEREAARFAPGLRVHTHHGGARVRGGDLVQAADRADLIVTTYALLAKDVEDLRRLHLERVVLDEAQHVKNERTAAARAARKMQARHRVALTGTPVENRLVELRAILDFVNPGMLGSAAKFRAAFTVPIEAEGDRHAMDRLRVITAPFILRRVKTDPGVIDGLPEKQEMTVRVNLTAEQAALYEAVIDDLQEKLDESEGISRRGAVLAALMHLKQVCNHPAQYLGDGSPLVRRGGHRSGKLALVEDLLTDIIAEGGRVLLFTQFRRFGAMLEPWIAERFGLAEIPFLHGGVPRGERDRMVARFQETGGPPVMLLSLGAGGTGLNLTAANHVIHLDRWWNPAVENQATDRAYRIGQRRNVQVRKLVSVGTLEERIDELLSGKSELARVSVGGGESWVTELDDKALQILVALGEEARGE